MRNWVWVPAHTLLIYMTFNDVSGLSGINRMDEGNNGGGYSRGPPVRGFEFLFAL